MLINWVAGGVFLQRTRLSNHRDLHIKHLTVLCHLYLDKAGKKKKGREEPRPLSAWDGFPCAVTNSRITLGSQAVGTLISFTW